MKKYYVLLCLEPEIFFKHLRNFVSFVTLHFPKVWNTTSSDSLLILGRKHFQNSGPLAHHHSLQGPKILCCCETKAAHRNMTYISTLDTIEHFPKCLLLGILATRLQAVKDNEPDSNPKQKAEIEHVGIQLEKVATLPHRCSHGGRSHGTPAIPSLLPSPGQAYPFGSFFLFSHLSITSSHP